MSKPLQIAIAVVCLAGAGFLLLNYFTKEKPGSNEGPPDSLYFVCANPDCGHGFSWSRAESDGAQPASTCPDCGTPDGYRAAQCSNCGHYQELAGHGTYSANCPECNAPMPKLTERE